MSGCQIAGSGHMRYIPPQKIICNKEWKTEICVSLTLPDPKEKYGKFVDRYKDVNIHIRDSLNENYINVPMIIKKADQATGEIIFTTTMKAIPCNTGIEYVEYYIDFIFDHNYQRTKIYKIPVSKK